VLENDEVIAARGPPLDISARVYLALDTSTMDHEIYADQPGTGAFAAPVADTGLWDHRQSPIIRRGVQPGSRMARVHELTERRRHGFRQPSPKF
jgi:hypothetical protein